MSPSRSFSHHDTPAFPDTLTGRVSVYAGRQYGLLTREQFLTAGGSPDQLKRWLDDGRLVRIAASVYRMAGVPQSWHAELLGHCLASGGFASHRSAGRLLGASDLERTAHIDITVPRERKYRVAGINVHQSGVADLAGVHLIRNIPVCSPDRFLVDMGKVWRHDSVEHCADDLLRLGLVTWDSLRSCYLAHAKQGRNGCGVIRALIEARYGENDQADSKGERLLLRTLDEAGFTDGVLHHPIHTPDGRFVMETDIAWPALEVCVMFDGLKYHLNAAAFEADSAKRRWATSLGWIVIVCTWKTITVEPWVLIRQLEKVLDERRALVRGKAS